MIDRQRPFARHLGTVRLVAATLAVAAAVTIRPPGAAACGMETFYVRPRGTPVQLLARARKDVERRRPFAALGEARAVTTSRRATPTERAQAWAVVAWVRTYWQEKAAARDAMARSRALDPAVADALVAQAPKSELAQAIRRVGDAEPSPSPKPMPLPLASKSAVALRWSK